MINKNCDLCKMDQKKDEKQKRYFKHLLFESVEKIVKERVLIYRKKKINELKFKIRGLDYQ